jgi:MFS family permease
MRAASTMSATERRAAFALAGVSALRMFGLFGILPVLALWAETLPGGGSRLLAGVALGAYGITQALLQIPYGWASDRWGRKRVLYFGLTVFAVGSLLAGSAHSIYTMIAGRILQGAGAISGVVIALTADLTRDSVRTKAMAVIGIAIGTAFMLSLMAGPLLARALGVPGIFTLTALLAVVAIAAVRLIVPDPIAPSAREAVSVWVVLRDPVLAQLNYGIFVLHAVLIALFVVVPFSLRSAGLPADAHWRVYLPVMAVSVLLMLGPLLWSERRGRRGAAFLGAILVLTVAQAGLAAVDSVWALAAALTVFFGAFNLLEASLPAHVSRAAPERARGTATGLYSSMQFLGAAAGGIAGGALSERFGPGAVLLCCGGLTLSWLLVAAAGSAHLRTRVYPVPKLDARRADRLTRELCGVQGVREATVRSGEGVARLKVDSRRFDERSVLRLIEAEG